MMSVLVFIDESRWQPHGKDDQFITLSGVAFEELRYDEFCRKILGLKYRFFKRHGVNEYPLRGRALLGRRSLESYRKVEFVRELLSLSRTEGVTTFAFTHQLGRHSPIDHPAGPPGLPHQSRAQQAKEIPYALACLLERVNSFMLEKFPGQMAKLIFGIGSQGQDLARSDSLMELIYRSPYGRGFSSVLGTPMFVPPVSSPGLQLADLCAYIVNQHSGGRYQVRDFYAEVESMQFISDFEKDEYKMRGINSLY